MRNGHADGHARKMTRMTKIISNRIVLEHSFSSGKFPVDDFDCCNCPIIRCDECPKVDLPNCTRIECEDIELEVLNYLS